MRYPFLFFIVVPLFIYNRGQAQAQVNNNQQTPNIAGEQQTQGSLENERGRVEDKNANSNNNRRVQQGPRPIPTGPALASTPRRERRTA